MVYVLTNGHTYITKKPNGKFTTTYDSSLASQYDAESKAWNVLNCLPRTYKEDGYLPKKIEVKEASAQLKEMVAPAQPERKRFDPVSYPIEDSEWMTDFKKSLKIVDKTLSSLKPMYANLYSDLTRVTDEIDDLEHAIELVKANAVQRCFLENELKKARKIRRECKDAMSLIEMVLKFNLDDWGTGRVQSEIVRLETRCYTPKVRDDIFV